MTPVKGHRKVTPILRLIRWVWNLRRSPSGVLPSGARRSGSAAPRKSEPKCQICGLLTGQRSETTELDVRLCLTQLLKTCPAI